MVRLVSDILSEVVQAVEQAKTTIFATSLVEHEEPKSEYYRALELAQKRGVQLLRKSFTCTGSLRYIDVRAFPFHRMLLIDNHILFFAVPNSSGNIFFATTESVLANAYLRYFLSIPQN